MSENQEKLNEQLFNVVADGKIREEAKLKKVKYLVYLGADVNARALGIGKSILVFAKESKDEEVVKFLQDKGAIEIYPTKEEALELSKGFWDDKGELKSLENIKELLKKGADVNVKDEDGRTALMKAANLGKLDVVKCLAELGADWEAKDECGKTALMTAANYGELEVVKYLVEGGADLEAKNGYGETALMKAVNWGTLDVVKCLVEGGADVNASDKYGNTALSWAVYNGHLEMVKYLAECGVDLEAKNEDGDTALDIARKREKADCVKFLKELQQKEKGNWKIWQRMFGGRD